MKEPQNTENVYFDNNYLYLNTINDRMEKTRADFLDSCKNELKLKNKIIEDADDMTTKEKIIALDKSFSSYKKEVLRGLIVTGTASLILFGLVIIDRVMIMNNRNCHKNL